MLPRLFFKNIYYLAWTGADRPLYWWDVLYLSRLKDQKLEQIFNSISFNTEIGLKVFFTIAFLLVLWLLRHVANAFIRESIRDRYNGQIWFWSFCPKMTFALKDIASALMT